MNIPVLFVVMFFLANASCSAIWFSKCFSRFCSMSNCCRSATMAFFGASFCFWAAAPPNQPHMLIDWTFTEGCEKMRRGLEVERRAASVRRWVVYPILVGGAVGITNLDVAGYSSGQLENWKMYLRYTLEFCHQVHLQRFWCGCKDLVIAGLKMEERIAARKHPLMRGDERCHVIITSRNHLARHVTPDSPRSES